MLKPMDIHNVEFKRSFKGYNPEEVDDYLASIVSKYETVYQENRRLQEELQVLQQELDGKEHQEQDVLDLISLTKQTVQELKNMANQEAASLVQAAEADGERIISEARLEAQRILADAEERLAKTQRAERQLRETIRLTMESIWGSLTREESEPSTEATRLYREIAPSLLETDDEEVELTSE